MTNSTEPKYDKGQIVKWGDEDEPITGEILGIQYNAASEQWAYKLPPPAGEAKPVWINEEDIIGLFKI